MILRRGPILLGIGGPYGLAEGCIQIFITSKELYT